MKSRDYVERALAEGRAEFEYDEVSEFSTPFVAKCMIDYRVNLERGVSLFSHEGCLMSKVKYDPNADFNYFATSFSIHAGRLPFTFETAGGVLRKVFNCQTYNKRIIKPELANGRFFDKYYFDYTVGDIVLFYDYTLCDGKKRTIATLPIKFDVFQKKRGM